MVTVFPTVLLLVVIATAGLTNRNEEEKQRARERGLIVQDDTFGNVFGFGGCVFGPLFLLGSSCFFMVTRYRRIKKVKSELNSAPFAAYGPPQKVLAESIDDLDRNSLKTGRFYMAQKFFVDPDPLNIWRYDDLIWAFFEPDEECLVMKYEKQDNARLPMFEDDAKNITAELKRRAPWIHAGYTEELAQLWRASSQKFTEDVVRRRGSV